MPKLDELYKRHVGQDIYIVGTGPTLRLFPLDFLKDKITIGLNQAYHHLHPTYALTIHPYLIPIQRAQWRSKWLTKIKQSDPSWDNHTSQQNDKFFYIFKNSIPTNWDWLNPSLRPENSLYVGCGIHTGAMHLACLMGAKTIFLIGCDFGSIGNQHHAHNQHIEPHQHSINDVYREYFFYAVKTREVLQQYYKVTILNLSSTLGIPHHANLEFEHAGLEFLPTPKIIEKNVRHTPLVRNFIQ
jgi:hypothetical protein